MAAYLGLGAVALAVEGGNPEWFVHFGSDPDRSAALPLARQVFGDGVRTPYEDGHDGQGFWMLARDPFLTRPSELEEYQDRPAYRSQRVLYPLLSAPFKVTGEHGLILGMVLVNVSAIGLGTWATARVAQRRRCHRWAPLAYVANPAVALAFTLCTADALAIALVLVAVDAIDRDRFGQAGAALALAALAKEPMVAAAAGLAAWVLLRGGRPELARGGSWRRAGALVLPAVAAVAAWGLYVRWRLDFPPTRVQEFGPLFGGYRDAWRVQWKPYGQWAELTTALLTLALAVTVLWLCWRRRTSIMFASLPYALMVPFFTRQVVGLSTNPLRAVGPLFTLVLVELLVGVAGSRRAGPVAVGALEAGGP